MRVLEGPVFNTGYQDGFLIILFLNEHVGQLFNLSRSEHHPFLRSFLFLRKLAELFPVPEQEDSPSFQSHFFTEVSALKCY